MSLQDYEKNLQEQLTTLIDSGRLPHAMVLEGGTQIDRTRLAEELAMARVCQAPHGKPCGHCEACKKVKADTHPDVQYLIPEKDKKNIAIGQVRDMRADAYVLPNDGDCKIYIIPEAERLQIQGQNALLKVLEEPPQFSSFILCCESKSILLPTILSRVAVFHLTEVRQENISAKKLSEVQKTAAELADALAEKNEYRFLTASACLEKKKDNFPLVLDELGFLVRDALVLQAGSTALLSDQKSAAEKLGRRYSTAALLAMEQVLTDLSEDLQRYANKNLTLTRFCSNLMAAAERN